MLLHQLNLVFVGLTGYQLPLPNQQEIDVDDNSKQDFDGSAFSYAGAANWEFAPNYKLSFVASHQERLPLAQELSANGSFNSVLKS